MIKKKNIQETLSIPSGLSDAFKQELGRRLLEEVRERTQRGIDKSGKPFKAYSKAYKGSQDFKIAGKSNTVNITQTGDTLAEMDILSINSSSIVIGYETGHEDAGKAHGIVTGEFGNSSAVTARRDFIGLPDKVINRIVQEMRSEPEFQEIASTRDSLIGNILGRFS